MISLLIKNSSIEYYYDKIKLTDKEGHYYFKPNKKLDIDYLILNGLNIKSNNPIIDVDIYGNSITIYPYELDEHNFIVIDTSKYDKDIPMFLDIDTCDIGCNYGVIVMKIVIGV